MSNLKISELNAAAALDGTELVECVQDGANVQTTAQDIADLAPQGITAGTAIAMALVFGG